MYTFYCFLTLPLQIRTGASITPKKKLPLKQLIAAHLKCVTFTYAASCSFLFFSKDAVFSAEPLNCVTMP